MNSKAILKSGDAGVAQTIKLMREYVLQYANNPQIKQLVAKLSDKSKVCTAKFKTIKNIFLYITTNLSYTSDPDGVELVKSAKHTILGNKKYGDCDDLSVALATLLAAAGYKVWFRTIAWKKDAGDNFSHVYVVVELPCGEYVMPCDPSMSTKGFGNEVKWFRKKDWSIN